MENTPILEIAQGPRPIKNYSFKSKTLNGFAAKFIITEYDNDTILICKIFIAKEEVAGITMIRSFKWCKVLAEKILIKKTSLFTICKEGFTDKHLRQILS